MNQLRSLLGIISLGASSAVLAITWENTVVTDPLNRDDCEVAEPMSWGGYIYSWPSKWHGVYWPYTDSQWLWFCEGSGYVSFGNDFEEVTQEQVYRIISYLRQAEPVDQRSRMALLMRARAIYQLRDLDDSFWAWFERLEAYEREHAEDSVGAAAARARAVELIPRLLADMQPGMQKAQLEFVLGYYAHRRGDMEEMQMRFARVRALEWLDDEGSPVQGSPYLEDLMTELEQLASPPEWIPWGD